MEQVLNFWIRVINNFFYFQQAMLLQQHPSVVWWGVWKKKSFFPFKFLKVCPEYIFCFYHYMCPLTGWEHQEVASVTLSQVSRCVRDGGLSSTGCNRSVTLGVTTQTEPGAGAGLASERSAHNTWQHARHGTRSISNKCRNKMELVTFRREAIGSIYTVAGDGVSGFWNSILARRDRINDHQTSPRLI